MDLCVLRKTLFSRFSINNYLLYLDVFFTYFLIDYKIEKMLESLKNMHVYTHPILLLFSIWRCLGRGRGGIWVLGKGWLEWPLLVFVFLYLWISFRETGKGGGVSSLPRSSLIRTFLKRKCSVPLLLVWHRVKGSNHGHSWHPAGAWSREVLSEHLENRVCAGASPVF